MGLHRTAFSPLRCVKAAVYAGVKFSGVFFFMGEGIFSSQDRNGLLLIIVKVIAAYWVFNGLKELGWLISKHYQVLAFVDFEVSIGSYWSSSDTIVLLGGAIYTIGGIGLLTKQRWGKIAGIFSALIYLKAFPFGTALGLLVMVGLWKNQAAYDSPEFNKSRKADA